MQKKGYSRYFAYDVFKVRFDDFFKNEETTLKQKVWAQNRGFLSNRIDYLGLTEENYRNFLSHFDYYKLHPINGRYSHWVDDKLTMKLILHPFTEYLPEYYYHIGNGEILRLMDCSDEFEQSEDDVINLAKAKGFLAIKLLSGSGGFGFIKLSFLNNKFFMNNKMIADKDLKNKINRWIDMKGGGYLITEYIKPHPELHRIWAETPNTVRIMVVRGKNENPKIANAYIRFGTKDSGVIDNTHAGGVTCHIDINTGCFSDGKIINNAIIKDSPFHPDTKILVEGCIPQWKIICDEVLRISNYLPEIIYFGYDIAVTEGGFKIIEINSHQGINFVQRNIPIFQNELCRDFFKDLILEKKRK